MIDIHSHILSGLDDGAPTFEESVDMVRLAAANGTTDIVASPHANEHYVFDPRTVEARIAELQAAVGKSPVIHYGCDFHLTVENIRDAMCFPHKYSIGHRSYLLVEFSDVMIPKKTSEIFAALISSGMRPVITHPERNPLLRRRVADLESWVEQGCLIQVTAQSYSGWFGRHARSAAFNLLHRGLVHVLASDGHDLTYRPPVLKEAYEYLTKHYDEEVARRLCVVNPRAILRGENLQPSDAPVKPKRWYSLW